MPGRQHRPPTAGADRPQAPWTFLTNHGHVLLAVSSDPDVLVADIAERVGISTRAALGVLRDLEEAHYLTRSRRGRRTHYEVARHQPFRHPAEAGHEVDELLGLFSEAGPATGEPPGR